MAENPQVAVSIDRKIVIALCALHLIIVVSSLSWHCLWSDEFHTIRSVQTPWREMLRERGQSGHPPLFFSLEKLFITILPKSDSCFRLLPAMAGMGTLLITYTIVRREAGRMVAVIACLCLLSHSSQLLICQMARSYSLLQFFIIAQTFLLISTDRVTWTRMAASSALTFFALATHGSSMIAIPAQVIATLIVKPQTWPLLLAMAVGLCVYISLALRVDGLVDVERHIDWIGSPTIGSLFRFPALLLFGRQIDSTPWFIQLATTIFVAVLMFRALHAGDVEAQLATQWIVVWIASAIAASVGHGVCQIERYFSSAIVCQAIIVAMGTYRSKSITSFEGRRITQATLALLCGFSLYLYFAVAPFTPWREMARDILKNSTSSDIVLVGTTEVLSAPLSHYYPGNVEYLGEDHQAFAPPNADCIWICFSRFGKEETSRIPSALHNTFSRMTVIRYSFGALVKLEKK